MKPVKIEIEPAPAEFTVALGDAGVGIAIELHDGEQTAGAVIPHWKARQIARELNRAARTAQDRFRPRR